VCGSGIFYETERRLTCPQVPTAFVVGATLPAVAVAQGIYTAALAERWCGGQNALAADAGGTDDDDRVAESCGRATDNRLRRQNVFVTFNSILMVGRIGSRSTG